jgi:hypothetical protein
MANFQGFPSGPAISGKTLRVVKSSISIGLWGYLDFNQHELNVVAVDPWNPSRSFPGVTTQPGKTVGNSRIWNVTAPSAASSESKLAPMTAALGLGRTSFYSGETRPQADEGLGCRQQNENIQNTQTV